MPDYLSVYYKHNNFHIDGQAFSYYKRLFIAGLFT